MRFVEYCRIRVERVVDAMRLGLPGVRDLSQSHSARASKLRCRNCGSPLDHTDVACPECLRKITRFTLST